MRAGHGIAILVNANAKRGGRRIAAQIREALPGASVRLTRSIAELDDWVRHIEAPRALVAAGGDGSAVALLNSIRRTRGDVEFPVVGTIPLGTGNAWSHALGARKLAACIRSLAKSEGPLPTRRVGLFDCDGLLTFFAGSGWDAQVLNDFREQVEQSPSKRVAKSALGYVSATVMRTAPRALFRGPPHVRIENLSDEVFGITASGEVLPFDMHAGSARGVILYEGPAAVAGAATCPEFGFHFRAYPHAERMLGHINVRVYKQRPLRALSHIDRLWRGDHPLEGMHDWFTTHVRMIFSRPEPLQVGGEAVGLRTDVTYRAFDRPVDVVDWRRLAS